MVVSIDPKDPTPIYAQLERGLRAAIASGRLQIGEQLPTVRQLAVQLQVNANTVARVYADLERNGVLETCRGVGSFIRMGAIDVRPPDEHARRLRAFATRVLAEADAHGFTADDLVEGLQQQRRPADPGKPLDTLKR
jgi:GntR family transcriptional regulator